jgi:hypothetical protein
VGKLAYFFTTFVGAIPAGFGIYVMVRHFLDRAEAINGILLTVSIMITVCLFLVALTPFIVLIFYKDNSPQLAVAGAGAVGAGAAAGGGSGGSDPETEDEGFGDAIPTDFDQDELEASIPDSEFDDFEDDAEDEEDYDESEFEDFDLDEVE